jgi:hypothetical protein
MTESNSKDKILESLLTYLPNTASTVSRILDMLTAIGHNDEITREEIDKLLDNIDKTIKLITPLASLIPDISEASDDKDLSEIYKNAIMELLSGLRVLIGWVKDSEKPESDLKKSVDHLFSSSKTILEIVNILTK